MLRTIKCIVVNKTKVVRIILPSFSIFPIYYFSLSNVMIMEVFVKDFSVTTLPRILKFCTTNRYDKLDCVLKNQLYIAYQSLYLYIFLSLSNVMNMEIFCQRAVHQCSILAIFFLFLNQNICCWYSNETVLLSTNNIIFTILCLKCLLILTYTDLPIRWYIDPGTGDTQTELLVHKQTVNKIFERKIVNISLPISFNICFGCPKKRLIVTLLLSTHNICFGLEIRKLNLWYTLLTKGLSILILQSGCVFILVLEILRQRTSSPQTFVQVDNRRCGSMAD